MENLQAIQTAANIYGWSATGTNEKITILNKTGQPSAIATVKKNKYIFHDQEGNKLLSANSDIGQGAKRLMENYWYCKPIQN